MTAAPCCMLRLGLSQAESLTVCHRSSSPGSDRHSSHMACPSGAYTVRYCLAISLEATARISEDVQVAAGGGSTALEKATRIGVMPRPRLLLSVFTKVSTSLRSSTQYETNSSPLFPFIWATLLMRAACKQPLMDGGGSAAKEILLL